MNLYSLLGVDENSTPKQIRDRYRRLAMRHHPDRGGDAVTFSAIQNAYEVLINPFSRKEYDDENLTEDFPDDIIYKPPPKNSDIHLNVFLNPIDYFKGATALVEYSTSTGNKICEIEVSPGTKNNEVVFFKGMGDDTYSSCPGNLYVTLIMRSENWTRKGDDALQSIDVDVLDLIVGCVIIVETPCGNTIDVEIPPGTKTDAVFTFHNWGFPYGSNSTRGDMHVIIKPSIPVINDPLTLKDLSEISSRIKNDRTL